MRVRLVQLEVHPGRPPENAARMLDHIRQAAVDGVNLLVFPEMAVPGYLIGDDWEHESFIRECEACNNELRAAAGNVITVFGSVAPDWKRRNEDGRVRKYNALFVAHQKRFIGPRGGPYDFVVKTLMPNYREFDDSRHFYDLRKLAIEERRTVEDLIAPVEIDGLSLGCLLCEDAWDTDYAVKPLDILASKGVDIFVNASCSPFTLDKNNKRNRVFSAKADAFGKPLVYVNNVGIQNNGKTVFTFDGSSCIYDGHGNQIECERLFTEDSLTAEIPLDGSVSLGKPVAQKSDSIAEVCQAVEYGTREFMRLCGVKRVTVGISGGIDSAVVAAIYRRILDPSDLLLVSMPGPHTSPTTRKLARLLAVRLGTYYAEVPIADSVNLTRRQVDGLELLSADGNVRKLELSGLMLENIQARDRSSRVLAAVSAAFGGVFTCNANKAEATVGYTTFYGDLCGYLANIADLWKGEVYDLARYLNSSVYGSEVIPEGCIDLVPSAELSPEQNVDQGKGDPLNYPYHDLLFKSWVERWNRATPEEILGWHMEDRLEQELGYAGKVSAIFKNTKAFVQDLERWWKCYRGMGLAKRIQAPPVLAVKRRAFGFDHRESQAAPYFTRRYLQLKAQLGIE